MPVGYTRIVAETNCCYIRFDCAQGEGRLPQHPYILFVTLKASKTVVVRIKISSKNCLSWKGLRLDSNLPKLI